MMQGRKQDILNSLDLTTPLIYDYKQQKAVI